MKKVPAKSNSLYQKIKNILDNARRATCVQVNFIMVEAYWNIGKMIVEHEQQGSSRAEYGASLIVNLSRRLTQDFGHGFSEQNLWSIRQFYSFFPILSTLWRELSWSHYKLLIRIDNNKTRKFYGEETVKSGWSVRTLERQIHSFYYERLLSGKDKKKIIAESKKKSGQLALDPKDFIKDPYVLEFLNLSENQYLLESKLEQALISHLQQFLLELGRGFSFVARQKRISTETQHFYIDLVFYNFILKCFVLIDLKIGKLTHQDIGQMDMYLRLFADKLKQPGDNPPLGILLCGEKDETVVKYSVLKENKNIFASKYKLYLPTEKELVSEIEHERAHIRLLLENQKSKRGK